MFEKQKDIYIILNTAADPSNFYNAGKGASLRQSGLGASIVLTRIHAVLRPVESPNTRTLIPSNSTRTMQATRRIRSSVQAAQVPLPSVTIVSAFSRSGRFPAALGAQFQ